jgi:peptide chain release factor 3
VLNLLDTPGHQDFSEDTYRVLTAVDSAVMVLDAARGVEPQTIKLFEVCRQRGLPVLHLRQQARPARRASRSTCSTRSRACSACRRRRSTGRSAWAASSRGSTTSRTRRAALRAGGARRAGGADRVTGVDDPHLAELLGPRCPRELVEEVELLALLRRRSIRPPYLAAETPVFFGSALNNFGVASSSSTSLRRAGAAAAACGRRGRHRRAGDPDFTGFVFKIQANMDRHTATRWPSCASSPGASRPAWRSTTRAAAASCACRAPTASSPASASRPTRPTPATSSGWSTPASFAIGDTVCSGAEVRFPRLPRFPPEHFARLRPTSVDKKKAFDKGLLQLEEEGAIQVLYEVDALRREPILAAVGELQFDVIRSRLEMEYRVETALDRLSYRTARWLAGSPESMAAADWPMRGALKTRDRDGRIVGLFEGPWVEDLMRERNPDIEFAATG